MTISRLFRTLYILLEHEKISAPQLARRLEVSVRTVYRDVQALCEAGVPVYAERGHGGGIRILPSFKLSKALLTDEDRRVILASLTALSQSGGSRAQTLSKLADFFGGPAQDWVRIDLADWGGQCDALIPLLRTAILERRQLSFDYAAESGHTARRVCPFRLWFKGHAWYLHAYCPARGAMRLFKLARMRNAAMLTEGFPPEAVKADAHAEDPTRGTQAPLVRLTLEIDACMAYRVYDDFADGQITRLGDGSFRVEAAYPPGAWIESFLLGYGAHVDVVSPPELRERLRQTALKMVQRHQT